jgi:hypothetical protein
MADARIIRMYVERFRILPAMRADNAPFWFVENNTLGSKGGQEKFPNEEWSLGISTSTNFAQLNLYLSELFGTTFPGQRQLICYVVNGWTFSSPADQAGTQHEGLAKMTINQRPADTMYLADHEDGTICDSITAANSTQYEAFGHPITSRIRPAEQYPP